MAKQFPDLSIRFTATSTIVDGVEVDVSRETLAHAMKMKLGMKT